MEWTEDGNNGALIIHSDTKLLSALGSMGKERSVSGREKVGYE